MKSGEKTCTIYDREITSNQYRTGTRYCQIGLGIYSIKMIMKPSNGTSGSNEGAMVLMSLPFVSDSKEEHTIQCFYSERGTPSLAMNNEPQAKNTYTGNGKYKYIYPKSERQLNLALEV